MNEMINPALCNLHPSAIRTFSRLAAEKEGCVRLTLGEPDFDTPAPIGAALIEALNNGETHYIPNAGDPKLRAAVAAHEQKHGLCYAPEEVILTAGATEALFVALFGVLRPGDEIIIPTPAFLLYEQQAALCRAKAVMMDTTADGFQLRRETLEKAVSPHTRAILLNSPNNPTGTVYDRESLDCVYQLAEKYHIMVICDDVYRDLVYTDRYQSFAAFSELKEQVLCIGSFSKPYAMTGWRMGYLLCDRSMAEPLGLLHQYLTVSTPSLFQKPCLAALETEVAPMREIYRCRRDLAAAAVTEMGLPLCVPEGAFYLFPSIQNYTSDDAAFCKGAIEKAGVALTPGSCFGAPGHVRISYACDEDTLKTGLNRLSNYLKTF